MEQILALRIHRGKLQYRAKWQGYNKDPNYYDTEGFKNSPYKLRQYYEEYPDKPGPPRRLREWLTVWENDGLIRAHNDNNAAEYSGRILRRRGG